MLSEEAIDRLSDRLINRIESLNKLFFDKLGKQLVEVGKMTPSQLQVLLQSVQFGNDLQEIINYLSEITNMNINDIYEILEEVAIKNQNFSKRFYEYSNTKFIPYKTNKVLQRQVKAYSEIVAKEFKNLAQTTAFKIDNSFKSIRDSYVYAVEEAILGASQGRESYQSAINRVIKQLTNSGLKTVDYASGYSRRLDSSIRMNVLDGINNLSMKLQDSFGNDFGADGIEVSHHKNCAPDHVVIDGKQFKKSEFEKLNNSLARHVGNLNCYHYYFPIIIDVTTPQFADEEIRKDEEMNNKGFEFEGKHYTLYEGQQLQRRIETEIRKTKEKKIGAQIINKTTGNREELDKYENKINQLTNKYNELSKLSGLPTKIERLRIKF